MIITLESLGTPINITIPDTYDSIGIAMSGGMDSALLFALLQPYLDLSKVTVFTVDLKQSKDVVRRILDHLGASQVPINVQVDPRQPNGALKTVFERVCTEVDYFYTGTNSNPPWADTIPEGQKPKRYQGVQWRNIFMPFALHQKTHILHLYKTQNLVDLIPLTHTCTENPLIACGHCFACRERKWAFEQNNMIDPSPYLD